MVRIVQLEGETQYRGDRPQGDVALVPIESDAEGWFALELAAADAAGIGDGACIRPGLGSGECEARHLFAARAPRQEIGLLLLGAVIEQQLGGAGRNGR